MLSECNIRSGLSDVTAMCLGNFSPAFMKLICFNLFPGWCFLAIIALVTSFAITLSAWSWRQRYRLSPKAFGQLLRVYCKDPFLAHSWQLGVSIFPHMCRFVGLGNTSYTDLMRNRISIYIYIYIYIYICCCCLHYMEKNNQRLDDWTKQHAPVK